MNQHPPGSINNPLHASTLNRLVDATDYRSGNGKQWIRTVCGTAFHALMRDYLTTRKITKDCLAYLKEAIAAERDGVEWGRDQNEPWAWGLIHHWFTAITTKWAPPKGPLFCEWSFLLSIPINGQDVWFEGTADLIAPEAAEIIDYKTGSKPPDHTHSAQHHLYCLAARYALWSNPKHHADRHQLDWATITEPLRKFGVAAPRFTYLLLDRMVGASAGAWSMPGFARDSKGMREDDSLAYITELTKRYLENQPTRLAVAIPTEPSQPEPQVMGNPQQMIAAPTVFRPMAQIEWNEEELATVKAVIAKDFTNSELQLFAAACKRTQLDPFSRQIFAYKLGGKVTIQISIDGFRVVAERSGKYAGQLGPFWCGPDGTWKDVWLTNDAPTAAKVGVLRVGFNEPLWAVATTREYKNQNNALWNSKPSVMLAKCAEALALRKAFPNDLSGLYAPEEMQQDEPAEPIKPVAVEVAAPEQPAAPQFTWGEPRGEGFASDAQIKRLKANCAAMGVGEAKCLARIIQLAGEFGTTGIASVAEIPFPVATRIVIKVEEALKAKGIPRPEREKTEAERVDEQVRQIVGELRTKRAKELAELVRSGPLSATEIIDIMANEAAPDVQFSALAEPQQEQVLHTIKRAAQAAADRVALAANGNGKH